MTKELKFDDIKEFFSSWGLYPEEEDSLKIGINEQCYNKLIDEAANVYGNKFAEFCAKVIDATDGVFYLGLDNWFQVEDVWKAFNNSWHCYHRLIKYQLSSVD
jgi:hypothetical protein